MRHLTIRWTHIIATAFLCLSGTTIVAQPLNVVASFSILADMTERVGGERIKVHTLVGRDADAHVYQPTPADARMIAEAQLVVVNGFGFEGWIDRLVKSSGYRGSIVTATRGVNALTHAEDDDEGHQHAGHHADHHDADPHAWQDLGNALVYADNIAQALAKVDPAGKQTYLANAEQFKRDIRTLDADVKKSFASIPEAQRKVVTTHDAFAYFGRAYGLMFIAPVGINTEAEPSAADIGRIIKQIRREKIPAVFLESISDPRLLEQIRRESGARVGGTLYSDSLSATEGPAPSYLDMMHHNARTLAEALSGAKGN